MAWVIFAVVQNVWIIVSPPLQLKLLAHLKKCVHPELSRTRIPMFFINACQKHQNLSVYAAETVTQFFCSTSMLVKNITICH